MNDGVIGLQGKSYNGTPYAISIIVCSGKVNKIILKGRPCKSVKDIVYDFTQMHANVAENVINTIKLKMLQHNEYVQTVRT